MPVLGDLLTGDDSINSHRSAFVLIAIGKEGVPTLIHGLRCEDASVQQAVAYAINKTTESRLPSPELHTPLKSALQDSDDWVRYHSALALVRSNPKDDEAIQTIISIVKDGQSKVRANALVALDGIAPRATELIPTLIAILEDETETADYLHDAAICALAQMGSAAKEALPVLTQLLSKADYRHVPIAARALRAMGADARCAVPALRRVSYGTHWKGLESFAATIALWEINRDTNAALTLLPKVIADSHYAGYLGSSKVATNTIAIAILGEIGPAAHDTAPCLLPLLKAPSPHVRAAAERALQKIDPDGTWRNGSQGPPPPPDPAP